MTGVMEEDGRSIEIFKDYNSDKNTYKKVVIRDQKITGVIMVGNIDRAGIYAGLIKNKIDISSIKDNISREDFGIINLPVDYKKHLVLGEGIEI
jgi:NAD(P)H-nitrite reductase large subunit